MTEFDIAIVIVLGCILGLCLGMGCLAILQARHRERREREEKERKGSQDGKDS